MQFKNRSIGGVFLCAFLVLFGVPVVFPALTIAPVILAVIALVAGVCLFFGW
jgi:hypothetical protein